MSLSLSLSLSLCLSETRSIISLWSAQDLLVQSSLHFTFDSIFAIQSRKENVLLLNTDFIFYSDLPDNLNKDIYISISKPILYKKYFTKIRNSKRVELSTKAALTFLYLMLTTLNARNVSSLLCLPARRVKPPVYILGIED